MRARVGLIGLLLLGSIFVQLGCEREKADSARSRKTRAARRGVCLAEALNGRTVHVDKVVDGDTLHVRAGSQRAKVRVLGIDCPETRRNRKCMRQGKAACEAQIPRGKRATRRAVELANRKTVTLESAEKCDKYGRVLAYVRLGDGRDLGLTLIRDGLCDDFSPRYPHPRGTAYSSARP